MVALSDESSPLPPEGLFEKFRLPLILGILGLLFTVVGVRIFLEERKSSVEFIEQSTRVATQAATIKADIEGEVEKPGVYELSGVPRVQDLLLKAGGLTAAADRNWVARHLNLAGRLTDGAKIYIPAVDEVVESVLVAEVAGSTTSNNTININSASTKELEELPGIGPVTAEKIIAQRPYTTTEELVSKKILGTKTFDKIKDKISTF